MLVLGHGQPAALAHPHAPFLARDRHAAVVAGAILTAMKPSLVLLAVAAALFASSLGCKSGATVDGRPSTGPWHPWNPMTYGDLYDRLLAAGMSRAEYVDLLGAREDQAYIPAEFKAGADRWRDTGVYVDGKARAMLAWGELPVGLEPVWIKNKVSAPKRPNSNDPGWTWQEERRYRFVDYLKAIQVDVAKVKAMHVYGPKLTDSIVATGADLRGKLAEGFQFRFGGLVQGKAIPVVPLGFGNGRTPDKISAVMIYVEKEPPVLVRNEGFKLGEEIQLGVPYFGEPLRGGVRIYVDDLLAAYLKRQELQPADASKGPDGELRFSLFAFLQKQGVATDKLVEAYIIRGERRTEKLTRAELETTYFTASAQAKGGVLIGDKKRRANSLALHTRALDPKELPVVRPNEEL